MRALSLAVAAALAATTLAASPEDAVIKPGQVRGAPAGHQKPAHQLRKRHARPHRANPDEHAPVRLCSTRRCGSTRMATASTLVSSDVQAGRVSARPAHDNHLRVSSPHLPPTFWCHPRVAGGANIYFENGLYYLTGEGKKVLGQDCSECALG